MIYNFFEQLLLQPVEDSENLVERAGSYGYELSKPQQIVIFSPSNLEKYVQEEKIKDEFAIVALKTQLEQLIRDILVMQGKNSSKTWVGGSNFFSHSNKFKPSQVIAKAFLVFYMLFVCYDACLQAS